MSLLNCFESISTSLHLGKKVQRLSLGLSLKLYVVTLSLTPWSTAAAGGWGHSEAEADSHQLGRLLLDPMTLQVTEANVNASAHPAGR